MRALRLSVSYPCTWIVFRTRFAPPLDSRHAMQSAQFQLHAEIEAAPLVVCRPPADLAALVERGAAAVAGDDDRRRGLRHRRESGRPGRSSIAAWASTLRRDAIRLARQRFPQVRFVARPGSATIWAATSDRARLVLLTDVLEHVPRRLSPCFPSCWPRPSRARYFLLTVPADLSLWSEHDRVVWALPALRLGSVSSSSGKACRSSRCLSRTSTRGSTRPSSWCGRWNRLRASGGRGRHRFRLPSRTGQLAVDQLLCRRSRHRLVRAGSRRARWRRIAPA